MPVPFDALIRALSGIVSLSTSSPLWLVVEMLRHSGPESHHVLPAIAGTVAGVLATTAIAAPLAATAVSSASAAAAVPSSMPAPDASVPQFDLVADAAQRATELRIHQMQTAVEPAGARTLVAGAAAPIWLYARMCTASSPTSGFEVDEKLTEGITFRLAAGTKGAVLGERQEAGGWMAVGIAVEAPADGSPLPETVKVVAERFATTGALYHRRTIALKVVAPQP